MIFKIAGRSVLLSTTLAVGWVRFAGVRLIAAANRQPIEPMQRAEWMHFFGRTMLKAIGIRYRVEGRIPEGATLIVANHLSYLDIVIFSAATPCVFVAKEEIATWPVFGPLARMGGTIFVNRQSRMSAWNTAEAVHSRLTIGVPVLVFPEGTSTDGSTVERFHSALLGPAINTETTITPAAVFYETGTSLVKEQDVCWFGDDLFLPHLKKVLAMDGFTAVVRFSEPEKHTDRKTAAWRTHQSVASMRQSATRYRPSVEPELLACPLPVLQ